MHFCRYVYPNMVSFYIFVYCLSPSLRSKYVTHLVYAPFVGQPLCFHVSIPSFLLSISYADLGSWKQ